jgi:hypothetical protein
MTVTKVNGVTYASLRDAEFVDAPDFGGAYEGRSCRDGFFDLAVFLSDDAPIDVI